MPNINYYECCRCGIMTKQIKISQREVAAMQESPLFLRACSLINDLDGASFLLAQTGILRPYKCTKCGRVSNRSFGGEDRGYLAG